MMITPEYCRMMAAYNAWQNDELRRIVEVMPRTALDQDRGAFFGSLRGTLNHLLWGDWLWMARFDGGDGPEVGLEESVALTPTIAAWGADRFRMDGRITQWAERVRAVDLTGELVYRSVVLGKDLSKPMGQTVVHFFNHQTHHRGQIHAMLTAAGQVPGGTDLVLMPPPWDAAE